MFAVCSCLLLEYLQPSFTGVRNKCVFKLVVVNKIAAAEYFFAYRKGLSSSLSRLPTFRLILLATMYSVIVRRYEYFKLS